MKLYIKSFLAVAFITVGFTSCYYDNIEDLHPAPVIIPGVNDSLSGGGCDTNKAITYTADIKAIFQTNCVGCHSAGSSNGIDLSTYEGAKGVATKLVGSVTWDGTASKMPQNSPIKINDCYIAKIKKWVNTGTAE
jgi:mono/diheme cytochrome c family protein